MAPSAFGVRCSSRSPRERSGVVVVRLGSCCWNGGESKSWLLERVAVRMRQHWAVRSDPSGSVGFRVHVNVRVTCVRSVDGGAVYCWGAVNIFVTRPTISWIRVGDVCTRSKLMCRQQQLKM